MNITTRIREELKLAKKQDLKPDIIWIGKAERRELESVGVEPEADGSFSYEGLEVRFVHSDSWLSISCLQ